jgi:ribose 5-phosphate isomerase A
VRGPARRAHLLALWGRAVTTLLEAAELEKRTVGEAAAALVEDGMTIGLGTGSTVAYFLPALASRGLDLRCVATSTRTEKAARRHGLRVRRFEELDRLDLAVDGADQVAPSGWLVKGGGGALTREKIVAAAADRFVVIVSSEKLVHALSPPVPLEVLAFGAAATLAAVGPAGLRNVLPSPDGGLIADYLGPIEEPGALADRLAAAPGIVEHGLFAPELVDEILVAHGERIERQDVP